MTQPPRTTQPPRDFVTAQVGQYRALELGELPEALLWSPATDRPPHPLFIVAHGAGGTPEWHCEWMVRLAPQAFVLCLRGARIHRGVEGFYYPEHHTLERLFISGLDALHEVEPTAVQPATYVAFSQGATMGALMLPEHAHLAPRLMLIEGGYAWTHRQAEQFKRAGGVAVYFACGTQVCQRGALRSVEQLRAAGVPAELGYAKGAGHRPDAEVGGFVAEGLAWLARH